MAQRLENPQRGADQPVNGLVVRTATMTVTSRLARVDAALLTPVVRTALGKGDLAVTTWDCQVVKCEPRADGRLVCRVFGWARAAGRSDLHWSLFLKVPNATSTHYDPWHREPLQREVLLYELGLLGDLPGGIVAPRLLGLTHWADDEPWMWLQDVTGLPQPVKTSSVILSPKAIYHVLLR